MKRLLRLTPLLILFFGCSRLNQLTTDMSSETWLKTHPWIQVKLPSLQFILAEPSSSIIVFSLGIILSIAGFLFLQKREKSRSALLWGIGLLLWSLSTFFAGISYQAFSYELKFAGREIGLWTSWWEIWYLMVFTVSMNFIVSAVAYSSTTSKLRKGLLIYAIANSLIYLAVVLSGALIPNQFLASFECMLFFTGPSFIILSIVNLAAWIKTKSLLDARLFLAWIGFFIVTALYFVYYISGLADVLWKQGIWFNANDVLHIGLIIWVVYLLAGVKKLCADFPTDTTLQR
uniref:Uncharacterized protein n=1 Tax=Gracilinema caldarium TaxID=215591 RepID=A0A7C3EEJ1_9SPIR